MGPETARLGIGGLIMDRFIQTLHFISSEGELAPIYD